MPNAFPAVSKSACSPREDDLSPSLSRPHSGVFRTGHPNRKQPSEPQNHKIKREENEEADLTTKLALDNESDEIVREVTAITKRT